jgi:hypothetical protein
MIREHVRAGLGRPVAEGTKLGRPKTALATEKAIRAGLSKGDEGMYKIAAHFGVGTGTCSGLEPQWRCECVNGRRPLCRRTARWEHVAAGEARRLFAGTD